MKTARARLRPGFLAIAMAMMLPALCNHARAQEDGGVDYAANGEELLESIFVPMMPNAPFSLTLSTEWSRSMNNGGTFTIVNSRPIKRDSAGRYYQERWLMAPKGSGVRSRMSWIQIADPVAHTLLECNAARRICDLETLNDDPHLRIHPELVKSGTLKGGRGTHTHEDLGASSFAGLPVHVYRETTIVNAGVMGNDLPMTTVRETRFSPELGFNLGSTLDTPRFGRQVFTVTEVSTGEPDPKFFETPAGYTVVDRRTAKPKPAVPAQP